MAESREEDDSAVNIKICCSTPLGANEMEEESEFEIKHGGVLSLKFGRDSKKCPFQTP